MGLRSVSYVRASNSAQKNANYIMDEVASIIWKIKKKKKRIFAKIFEGLFIRAFDRFFMISVKNIKMAHTFRVYSLTNLKLILAWNMCLKMTFLIVEGSSKAGYSTVSKNVFHMTSCISHKVMPHELYAIRYKKLFCMFYQAKLEVATEFLSLKIAKYKIFWCHLTGV